MLTYQQERWRKPMVLVELCVPKPIWPFPDKILRQWRESSMLWRDRRISTKSQHLKGRHSNSNSHWLLGNSNGFTTTKLLLSHQDIHFFSWHINIFIFLFCSELKFLIKCEWKYYQPIKSSFAALLNKWPFFLWFFFLFCRKFRLKVWRPA